MFNKIIQDKAATARSAWDKGVLATVCDMLADCEANGITHPTETDLLNGARNWSDWAQGGCGLVYDADIAGRYCTPGELKRKRNGELPPNSRESWLDVEARAARQAARCIIRGVKRYA